MACLQVRYSFVSYMNFTLSLNNWAEMHKPCTFICFSRVLMSEKEIVLF